MAVAFGLLIPGVRLPFRIILRTVVVCQLQGGWLFKHPLHLAVMTYYEWTGNDVRKLIEATFVCKCFDARVSINDRKHCLVGRRQGTS